MIPLFTFLNPRQRLGALVLSAGALVLGLLFLLLKD